MTTDAWAIYSLLGYIVLFFFSIIGLGIFIRKRRRDRPPVVFKLLRGPGESLRKRTAKYDEDLMVRVGGAAFAPLVAALIVLWIVLKLHPTTWPQFYLGAGATGATFFTVLFFAGRWALRDLFRYGNDCLGYLGEREVAEHLEPLLARGYRVFHDMPAEGAGKKFNLDHVVVGPTGVALIETKTRRKGRARPGFKDHVVVYDGKQLIWPWGEDRHGLQQAKAEADWLCKWINQRTALSVTVKPILALPGWWVEMKARGDVIVVNSKSIAGAVEGKGPAQLTADQIDLIARQLDLACRDVDA